VGPYRGPHGRAARWALE